MDMPAQRVNVRLRRLRREEPQRQQPARDVVGEHDQRTRPAPSNQSCGDCPPTCPRSPTCARRTRLWWSEVRVTPRTRRSACGGTPPRRTPGSMATCAEPTRSRPLLRRLQQPHTHTHTQTLRRFALAAPCSRSCDQTRWRCRQHGSHEKLRYLLKACLWHRSASTPCSPALDAQRLSTKSSSLCAL